MLVLKAVFLSGKENGGKTQEGSHGKKTTATTQTRKPTVKFKFQSGNKNIYIQNILSNYFSFREGGGGVGVNSLATS